MLICGPLRFFLVILSGHDTLTLVMAVKHFLICATLLLSSMGLYAVDLSDALVSGSIWQKDRRKVCSTNFVGLRYMPIDDHAIRLVPELVVKGEKPVEHEKNTEAEEKSELTIGELKLGETIVRWDEDMITLNMLGLVYNRGDNGEISKRRFAQLIRESIKALDTLTASAGYVRESKGKGDEEHVGVPGLRNWFWQWENGVLLLEASATDMGNGNIRPEFIRIKMGATAESIATGGAENLTQAAWLHENVKREGGMVYIAGVPMVDQGQKGYCLPASVARVFAYYGADAVDQHALAQVCNTKTEGGTSLGVMYNELVAMGRVFHFSVQPLYANKADFASLVQYYVNSGIPMLWCVELNTAHEAGIPIREKDKGCHERLIIGYNTQEKLIYFTDSWGQGHELKKMSVSDAAMITLGLHVMIPNR